MNKLLKLPSLIGYRAFYVNESRGLLSTAGNSIYPDEEVLLADFADTSSNILITKTMLNTITPNMLPGTYQFAFLPLGNQARSYLTGVGYRIITMDTFGTKVGVDVTMDVIKNHCNG